MSKVNIVFTGLASFTKILLNVNTRVIQLSLTLYINRQNVLIWDRPAIRKKLAVMCMRSTPRDPQHTIHPAKRPTSNACSKTSVLVKIFPLYDVAGRQAHKSSIHRQCYMTQMHPQSC